MTDTMREAFEALEKLKKAVGGGGRTNQRSNAND